MASRELPGKAERVKSRPILFSSRMIKAILAGAKTQTRRVVKWKLREPGLNLAFSGLEAGHYCSGHPSSGWVLRSRGGNSCWNDRTFPLHCSYGVAGDRLWVKETLWRGEWTEEHFFNDMEGNSRSTLQWCRGEPGDFESIAYVADGDAPADRCERWKKVPAIFCPRWASRLELDITNVRVERLQDISEEDAKAEGAAYRIAPGGDLAGAFQGLAGDIGYRAHFADLWRSINGAESWDANVWVWVIDFRRVELARSVA